MHISTLAIVIYGLLELVCIGTIISGIRKHSTLQNNFEKAEELKGIFAVTEIALFLAMQFIFKFVLGYGWLISVLPAFAVVIPVHLIFSRFETRQRLLVSDEDRVAYLRRAVESPDADIRLKAVESLSTFNTPSAAHVLAQTMARDEATKVSSAALEALVKLGTTSLEALHSVLQDRTMTHRKRAAEVLEKIGDSSSAKHLCLALLDPEEEVSSRAFRTLVKFGKTSWDALLEALRSQHVELRTRVIPLLPIVGDGEAVALLLERLQDDDASVREAALRAVSKIKDPNARIGLTRLLQDGPRDLRICALQEVFPLQCAEDEQLFNAILECLKDADADIKRNAIRRLGQWKDARAIEHLVPFLKDENMKENAKWALQDLGWKPQSEEECKIFYGDTFDRIFVIGSLLDKELNSSMYEQLEQKLVQEIVRQQRYPLIPDVKITTLNVPELPKETKEALEPFIWVLQDRYKKRGGRWQADFYPTPLGVTFLVVYLQ